LDLKSEVDKTKQTKEQILSGQCSSISSMCTSVCFLFLCQVAGYVDIATYTNTRCTVKNSIHKLL